MKLLVVQLILFICLVITILSGNLQYTWVPLAGMIIPSLFITALACNWPILGLWAAQFEYGKRLVPLNVFEKLYVDNNYVTRGKQTIRVVHMRIYVRNHTAKYRAWVLYVGATNQPSILNQ